MGEYILSVVIINFKRHIGELNKGKLNKGELKKLTQKTLNSKNFISGMICLWPD